MLICLLLERSLIVSSLINHTERQWNCYIGDRKKSLLLIRAIFLICNAFIPTSFIFV